jgi:hypothetical protein
MSPRIRWLVAGTALALLTGAGHLAAQPPRSASRAGLPRSPAATAAPLDRGAIARRVATIQGPRRLTGLLILFRYDPALSTDLDLDDNGGFQDNGDRAIRQGEVWLSNRFGDRLSLIGRFASIYDYLDVIGEPTGTDLAVTHDLFFDRDGQLRAGGFWNVDDFVGAPAFSTHGATGSPGLRSYRTGQLVFLATVSDTEELYLLAK